VIAGLLLVPATAIAAVAIVGATARPPAAEAAQESTTTTEQTAEETTTTTLVDIDSLTDAEALEQACTTSAVQLIEREMDETISDLETAALDALRTICDEHGIPIAGPPQPEPIVRVVTVKQAPQDTTSQDAVSNDEYAGHDDDDYDDDDRDEDHEDEKDEDHEDHEDEEDEEDEDEG
jgi:hypothetical protein